MGRYRDTAPLSVARLECVPPSIRTYKAGLGEDVPGTRYIPAICFRSNGFYPFALDWQEPKQRPADYSRTGIYPRPGEDNRTVGVERQINFTRAHGLAGEGHYRVKYLMDNTQGLYDMRFKRELPHRPALQPAMPWIDNVPPTAPRNSTSGSWPDGFGKITWRRH